MKRWSSGMRSMFSRMMSPTDVASASRPPKRDAACAFALRERVYKTSVIDHRHEADVLLGHEAHGGYGGVRWTDGPDGPRCRPEDLPQYPICQEFFRATEKALHHAARVPSLILAKYIIFEKRAGR